MVSGYPEPVDQRRMWSSFFIAQPHRRLQHFTFGNERGSCAEIGSVALRVYTAAIAFQVVGSDSAVGAFADRMMGVIR